MSGGRTLDPDQSLAARAAWLHFAGGMTQGEVAKRLGLPSTRAHRLIARASREGMVRVFVDAPVSSCVALEDALAAAYGLAECQVAPDLFEPGLPLRALGLAGAAYLARALESGRHRCIGVGHGRTLAAMIEELPSVAAADVAVISLLGGFTRKFAANPYDVIYKLAEKTTADAYMLPAPIYADEAADAAVFKGQIGVERVLEMSSKASLLLVGIGEVGARSHLSAVGSLTEEETGALVEAGAVGELLGRFFDESGAPIESRLHQRVIAPSLDELEGRNIVAVAGGAGKARAIAAVLRTGLLRGLITDETTAASLVDDGGPNAARLNDREV